MLTENKFLIYWGLEYFIPEEYLEVAKKLDMKVVRIAPFDTDNDDGYRGRMETGNS